VCQAIDLRGGKGRHALYQAVRAEVPMVVEDRPMEGDIARILARWRARQLPAGAAR
jgi:histidine ammonia-lyase